ncbi:TIGR03617 family F420-dependent LLM class oxidoreductase [Pseudonocardia sp. NPDC049154]|uniref:TIGR03617 family F420-dependent LLM class oxidoreductase n=1 Tax=Pseudonocardia sp. NPDC049154 TaxID=3155501 RepID=UPI0033D3880E
MKVDTKLTTDGRTLVGVADETRAAVADGYDGVWSTESRHDPFLPLVSAAAAAQGVQLGTAVAVAFARSPMTLAQTAHDLQVLTGGRFLLGLGSQVKAHIERRFGMPWGRPAARMKEYVSALHAIWDAWNTGAKLDFRGDFYTHTLMTSFFSPEPSEAGPPTVYLAAVGEHMTRVAGEVCDGLMPHPFTTERYLRERTLPAVQAARESVGRSAEGFSISLQGLVVTGRTEEEIAEAVRGTRRQIAFYGSTPAYRPVLELHGWEHLGDELNTLSRSESEDRWQRMGELVDDEILHTFAVVAEPDRLGDAVRARFGGLVDRFSFYAPYKHEPRIWRPAIDSLTATQ